MIGWDEAKVIGKEEDRYKRWIKEAIEIRKRRGKTMNRDEGQYHLTHIFDEFLVKPGPKPPGRQSGNSVARQQTGNTVVSLQHQSHIQC